MNVAKKIKRNTELEAQVAEQGKRQPTSDGGTRQRWTRCGLNEPGGIQPEV